MERLTVLSRKNKLLKSEGNYLISVITPVKQRAFRLPKIFVKKQTQWPTDKQLLNLLDLVQ